MPSLGADMEAGTVLVWHVRPGDRVQRGQVVMLVDTDKAEIAARIQEEIFYELEAPVARVCSAEVPMPYARHLEAAALPQVEGVIEAVRRTLGAHA